MAPFLVHTLAQFVAQPLRQVGALGGGFLLRDGQHRHGQKSRQNKFLHGLNPFLINQ
jgi:hypothetical protein